MENSKGSSSIGNLMYSGNQFPLPPKIQFPNNVSQAYADYEPNPAIGAKHEQKAREGNILHHHHTSSENFVIEEQPSWLDDLLNEPETPVRRGRGGHRRSSSDSLAYLNSTNLSNISYADNDEFKFRNLVSTPSWSTKNFDHGKDARYRTPYAEMNSTKLTNRAWDSSLTSSKHLGTIIPFGKENVAFQSSGLACPQHESDGVPSAANEKHDSVESGHQEVKLSSEKKDSSNAKLSASETDTRRAKQQFAQRSRVRKLQYIAELERNVQGLQVEGSGVSAELEFLNQQNLILNMENKALKQRLENIAQEQLIKYLEQEVLEREIGRLRALYQQQQQHHQSQQSPQQPISSHRRKKSRDLESEFTNLSLKHNKDTNSGRDHMTGALRI